MTDVLEYQPNLQSIMSDLNTAFKRKDRSRSNRRGILLRQLRPHGNKTTARYGLAE